MVAALSHRCFRVEAQAVAASILAVVEPGDGVQGGPELEQELIAFLQDRIAKYKIPKSVDFVAELPRDPNGKLYKRKLRDPYWEGKERQI